jgi:glycosyltransferase involved in cell wall biosynthesis
LDRVSAKERLTMKLLLVHRFIRPDTPGYAHMLYIMGKRFAAEGHEVTIFSAQPSYNDAYDGKKLPYREEVDGMTVIRTPLLKESKKNPFVRSINVLIFCACLFVHAVFRGRAYDLMTVTTFPPTVMAFVARKIGIFRKTKYVYHCMDLYPEVAEAGKIIKGGWLKSIAKRIDKRNCDCAKAVVVLSSDMEQTVRERGVHGSNLHQINNFIIDSIDESIEVPDDFRKTNDKLRILFAGNIGRFQNLESIVEAIHLLADNAAVELHFIGAGVMVEPLKELSGDLLDESIFFHPYMPISTVMRVIETFDLGIVSLSPGVIKSAYPSKTMTYLESGCRLLTIVEGDSELAKFVISNDLGVVCKDASASSVVEAIEAELVAARAASVDRKRIREIGRSSFGQGAILNRWCRLLDQLAG